MNADSDAKSMYNFKPIGFLNTVFPCKNGTPRQPTICPSSQGVLQLNLGDHNAKYSVENLQEFSHIWLIFVFHKNGPKEGFTKTKIAPPRLGGRKVGIFSTRAPHRPNPIGLSLVKLDKIKDSTLFLSGLDIIDGTPVLDIKPYIPDYDTPVKKAIIPNWIRTPVPPFKCEVSQQAKEDILSLEKENLLDSITKILESDPRSNYRKTKCQNEMYTFYHDSVDVTAFFDDELQSVTVLRIKNTSSTVYTYIFI